jgi:hypothetical protein
MLTMTQNSKAALQHRQLAQRCLPGATSIGFSEPSG